MYRNLSNKYQNIGVTAFFVLYAAFYFMCFFYSTSQIMEWTSVLIGFVGLLCSIFLSFKKDKPLIEEQKDGMKPVDRWEDAQYLMGCDGIRFIVGESGAGKSVLLKQLKDNLEKNNSKVYLQTDEYDLSLPRDIGDYDYIIFDQFERILWWERRIDEYISFISRYIDSKIIILSVRKEYAADVLALLNGREDAVSFIMLDNKRIIGDKEKLEDAGITGELERYLDAYFRGDMKKESVLWTAVKNDELSMIQLDNICKRKGRWRPDEIEQTWDESRDNYDRIVRSFLQEDIEKCGYRKESVYEMLYFLSLDSKQKSVYRLSDFQNITLLPFEQLQNVVKFLASKGWIEKAVDSNKRTGRHSDSEDNWDTEYCMTHDYHLEKFYEISIDILDSQVRRNIDYYHANCQEQRGCDEGIVSAVYRKSQRFVNMSPFHYLNIMLYAMLVLLVGFNAVNSRLLHVGDINAIMWMFLSLAIGFSVLYIYNFSYHFLQVIGLKYILIPLIGMSACLYIYHTPMAWGCALGTEVCCTGIATLVVAFCCKKKSSDRHYFLGKGIGFFLIGVLVVGLGISNIYFWDNLTLLFILLILYVFYMGYGLRLHINEINLKAWLGRVLYHTSKQE